MLLSQARCGVPQKALPSVEQDRRGKPQTYPVHDAEDGSSLAKCSRISFPTSTRIKFQTAGIPMTEERKFAILFAATLLSARKLIDCIESEKPNFAKEYWVDKAINEAAFVLERIDRKWPTLEETSITKG